MSKFIIRQNEVPDIYKPMLYDNTFIKLFYGSRNSAKSDFAALRKLQRCLTMPYFKCLMTRKVQRAVKKSIYDKIRSVAQRHKIDHLFKFNDHLTEITCIENGNKFLPLGTYETLDSSGNAKSVDDPTDALIDEMDELSEEEFKSLMFSIRGCEDLEIIGVFNTNKIDEDHWIFKRWFHPTSTFEQPDGMHTYIPSKRADTIILHTNYLMNPFINKKIVDSFKMEKKADPEYYDVHGLGLIKTVKSTNLALKFYDKNLHVSKDVRFNRDALVYLSWDFNRLPHHTVGLWQYGGYDSSSNSYFWNLVKEFCLPDKSIEQVQEEINRYLREQQYMSNQVGIVCDYSGNKRTDHGNVTDINKIKQTLKRANFVPIDRTIVNPSVTASLGFLDSIFKGSVKMSAYTSNPGATLIIRINPVCKFHCDDFKKTKTNKEGNILKVKAKDVFIEDGVKVTRTYEARGHAVDGSRYLFTSIFAAEYEKYKSQFLN